MKTLLLILVGAIILALGGVGGYYLHKPQVQLDRVYIPKIITTSTTQSLICTGTLNESFSGDLNQVSPSEIRGVEIGSTPVSLICTTASH